jgi:hypothetical protein
VVKAHQSRLPAPYRTGYVEPLLTALPDVVVQLRQQFDRSTQAGVPSDAAMREARAYADTLVGAVRDWGIDAYHAPLTRFEAVVSNFYRSFLGRAQRAHLPVPLVETLPPLVTFAPTPDHGPFTLPVDRVRQFTGAAVGVVSLPACYAQHPLLWGALAHETGGHDVLHADPGLLEQLSAGVARLDGMSTSLRSLWITWIDEIASDVYGVLNIGPAFAVSLAAFFSALEAARASAPDQLGRLNTILAVSSRGLRDAHPVDLLRLHAAIGAVDALAALSADRRAAWVARLDAIATAAAGGATTIDAYDAEIMSTVQQLPLATMATAARTVGRYIATAQLAALGGGSIQDIETWDDADDTAAAAIAAAATSIAPTATIAAMGDDAQLLAGAIIALLDAPASYPQITAQLTAALDDSFHRDPIFGVAMPQSALALDRRGPALARTPASPQFPISLT